MTAPIPDFTDTKREIVAMPVEHFVVFEVAHGRFHTKARRAVRRRS